MATVTNMLADAQKNGLLNNEYWQKRLLKMITLAKENFVFQNLGKTTNLPRNMGTRTVSYRRYLSLPVDLQKQKLVEGVPPEALKLEGTKVSGVIDQYGAFFRITDWVDDIHMDDLRQEYQPELARYAAEVRERVTIASFTEASESFVGGGVGEDAITATDTMTLAELRKARLAMTISRRKPHRKYGRYLVAASPQVIQDLLDDDDAIKQMEIGNDNAPLKAGTVVNYVFYDLAFIETQILAEPTPNENDINIYTTYFIGDEAYAVIELSGKGLSWHYKPFKEEGTDPLAQLATVGYKMWYGAKVLDPTSIIAIKSAAAHDVTVDIDTDPYARPADQTVTP